MPKAHGYQQSAFQSIQKPGSRTVHRQRRNGFRTVCGVLPKNWAEVDTVYNCRRCYAVINLDPNLPAKPWMRK